MSELTPLPRPSKTENLESLYKTVSTQQKTAGQGLTIRSHLQRVPADRNNWGLSKNAGPNNPKPTDFINGTSWRFFNAGKDYHSVNFNLRGRVPGFTREAFDYARAAYRHDNSRYFG